MGKIKTKETVKDIKALDKTVDASTRMKETFVRTKERTQSLNDDGQNSANEYAENRVESGMRDTAYDVAHGAKDGTKNTVRKGKDAYRQHMEAKKVEQQKEPDNPGSKTPKEPQKPSANRQQKTKPKQETVQKKYRIKTRDSKKKTIKQSARSAEKQTIKTSKSTIKQTEKTVKTAEKTTEKAIKTAEKTAKAAEKAAKASAKAAQKAAQAAKATAKAVVHGVKLAVKATVAAVKAIIAGIKALVAAIAAGGWVAVVVIIVICLIALIVGSCFGIFFSGEDSGTGQTMQTAVQEINTEYDGKIQTIKNGTTYDVLEMSGSRAVWKEVLSVYSVKVTTDPNNPQEVASMDDSKKAALKEIFWKMNVISSRTETKTDTVITETDDGNGNIVETSEQVSRVHLYITVSHKTADEMATEYGFSEQQKQKLNELLSAEYNSMWASVLYGISTSSDQIVAVALTQLGNVGGQPYWSWYGFNSRVEWCACFVSWCGAQCGYIENGIIPKFAGCGNGVNWFKARAQWISGRDEPIPGMIIFFDWDNKGHSGPQDGNADHVGIVQKVENGIVYTVEGNTSDSCAIRQYNIGHYEILGYGTYNP